MFRAAGKSRSFFGRAVFFCLIMLAFVPSLCFAQRAGAHVLIKALHGSVKSIDTQKSSFVLETDEGDIKFAVTYRARIFRGTEIVKFSDIEQGDEASVRYYEDESAKKQVLSITLEG